MYVLVYYVRQSNAWVVETKGRLVYQSTEYEAYDWIDDLPDLEECYDDYNEAKLDIPNYAEHEQIVEVD